MKIAIRLAAVIAAMTIAMVGTTQAQITAGNAVVYRVGNGAAALTNAAAPVFIDEYSPAGVLISSTPVASTGAAAMTAVGTAGTEGIMSVSQDGNLIVFGGYRKDAGLANPGGDTAATTNRVIGTLTIGGAINTSVALTTPGGTFRSATTVDGSAFYIATSAAISHVPTPGPAATTVQIDARNSRQVNMLGNVLYASNGSTAITGKVQSYGTLPTGPTTAIPTISLATTDAVNGFVAMDLNPLVAGTDTVYALSTVENLFRKFTFDGTTWTAAGSFSASSAQNLTGYQNGTDVNFFATSGSALLTFVDASGPTGTMAGAFTSIATAGANTGFRGVATFNPVPEPASVLGMCALAMGGVAAWRRKRAAK